MTSPSLPHVLALSITLALMAGCGGDAISSTSGNNPATASAGKDAPVDEHALAMDIAATLQACSYDGAPVKVTPDLGAQPPGDCRDMVAQVMNFTGLPQNFDVVEADVPNAAAVILLDSQKLPRRVIAFNPRFIDVVRKATDQNNWGPVSIMAHEIGHHLSGHTIMPGGSQPPTELEADKFSGFVLYKMGAQLDDAQRAMVALVPEGDGPTHPGRGKRLAAIAEGWQQACRQQGGDCTGKTRNTNPVATLPRPAAAQSPVTDMPAPRSQPTPTIPPTTATVATRGTSGVDVLPAPDANATPMKFGRFVVDEFGVLDPAIRKRFEDQLREHARLHGVEIVTLLVKDLHGQSGDDYAQAMLRQLRVGKLDVGNGAVLVVAPEQGQVGVAMGPGVQQQMQFANQVASLKRWLDFGWTECKRKNACGNWTENLLGPADHIRRDTDDWDWSIRYSALKPMIDADVAALRTRMEGGPSRSLKESKPIGRFTGTVVDLAPPPGKAGDGRRTRADRNGYRAIHVRSPEGYTVMMDIHPRTEALMPAGRLAKGATYSFVARQQFVSGNPKDTQTFTALSYDLR